MSVAGIMRHENIALWHTSWTKDFYLFNAKCQWGAIKSKSEFSSSYHPIIAIRHAVAFDSVGMVVLSFVCSY